jgi:hypothetical protein
MRAYGIPWFVRLCLFTAIICLGLVVSDQSERVRATGNFTPFSLVTLSSSATGADADTVFETDIVVGDLTFSLIAYTTPSSGGAYLAPAPTTIASGLGDVAGRLVWNPQTLGLVSGPCDAAIPLDGFDLLSATVDNSIGNLVAPLPAASAYTEGILEPLRDDNGGGSPTNGLPSHVDRYPSYLNTIFNGVPPLVRYSGSDRVANEALVVELLVFTSAVLDAAVDSPNSLQDLATDDLGYTYVLVFNDPTAPGSPVARTDFCSPLLSDLTLYGEFRNNPCVDGGVCPNSDTDCTPGPCGDNTAINTPSDCTVPLCGLAYVNGGNGIDRHRNPTTAGQYRYHAYVQSQRDLDGDGLENPFDTCPYISTPGYDPRDPLAPDDPDMDMLPSSGCDPTPATNDDFDNFDGDSAANSFFWQNAGDNCPLVANGDQAEDEYLEPDNVRYPRGGPADYIGNACDLPETSCGDALDNDALTLSSGPEGLVNDGCPPSGAGEVGCLNAVDDDGDGLVNDGCPGSSRVATGHYHTSVTLSAKCIGMMDSDVDGWCDSEEMSLGSHPGNAGSTPENFSLVAILPITHSGSGGGPSGGEPVQLCNDGIDNDLDGSMDFMEPDGPDPPVLPHPEWPDCQPPNPIFPIGPPGPDTDGDGFSDKAEIQIGTDALGRCEVGPASGDPDVPEDDWPADLKPGPVFPPFNFADRVLLNDLGSFFAPFNRFNTSPPEVPMFSAGYHRRWDIVPGGISTASPWISLQDLAGLLAGTTNTPPMFGGAQVFNGPACTAHPVFGD